MKKKKGLLLGVEWMTSENLERVTILLRLSAGRFARGQFSRAQDKLYC